MKHRESPLYSFSALRTLPGALEPSFDALAKRACPNGGFASDSECARPSRPDATAWAILALAAVGTDEESLELSRSWLAGRQLSDGRVCLTRDHREVVWPTPLAVLAWQGSPVHLAAQERAAEFLLGFGGESLPRVPMLGHDTTLIGWPWIARTHSWVEPTALAMMALRVAGHRDHARVDEGRDLLLDRRLSEGGWNYGNTTAFGQGLLPAPSSTGIALSALIGLVEAAPLQSSIAYLSAEATRLRSPLSLAWSLLGLGAFGARPAGALVWVVECLERQTYLGPYDTALLAQLLLSAVVSEGIVGGLAEDG